MKLDWRKVAAHAVVAASAVAAGSAMAADLKEIRFGVEASYAPFEYKTHSVDPQWMTNAQIRYDRGSWYIAGYVQNIFDVLYVTNGIGSGKLSTANGLVGEPAVFDRYAAPRTYGVRIGFSY